MRNVLGKELRQAMQNIIRSEPPGHQDRQASSSIFVEQRQNPELAAVKAVSRGGAPSRGRAEYLLNFTALKYQGYVRCRRRPRYGADSVLFGTPRDRYRGYWTMQWSLNWNGVERRWRLDRVNFDVALAAGIDGAARILSARR